MKETKKGRVWGRAILPALFLSFTFFFFGPLEIYLSSRANFWFQPGHLLPGVCVAFLTALLLLSGVGLLLRGNAIWSGAVFGLGMALYLQGNWTSFISYGEMDGQTIDWGSYGAWPYVNGALWIVVIALPVVAAILLKNKEKFQAVLSYVSLGFVGMQCITLLILALTGPSGGGGYYVARDDQMLELSQNHNVIVMLLDGYQTSYFQQALDETPEAKEALSGFTFFDDVVGTSLFSEEGSATILTGNQLRTDLPFSKNIDYIYNESEFFPALEKKGYDTRYYIDTKLVSGEKADVIKNIVLEQQKPSSYLDLTKVMYRVTAFRYMPHALKQNFWFSDVDIDASRAASPEDESAAPEFVVDDAGFNQMVLEQGVNASKEEEVYRLYYLHGAHHPYVLDENGNTIKHSGEAPEEDAVEDLHDNEWLRAQVLGSLRIILNFVQALKDEGIYDQTDIVLTADHGWANRRTPLLAIKPRGAAGEMTTSHAQISCIEDLGPTLLSMIDPSLQTEKTVFDYQEGEIRKRRFYQYDINAEDRSYNGMTVLVAYDQATMAAYRPEPSEKDLEYRLGDSIVFTEESDGRRYFREGIHRIEKEYAWSLGKQAHMYLDLSPNDLSDRTELEGHILLASVFHSPQRVTIKAKDQILYDDAVDNATGEIDFTIPIECLEDDTLTLELDYPDACSPASLGKTDKRVLAVGFQEIWFE